MRIAVSSSSRVRLTASIGSVLLYVGLFAALHPVIGRAGAILSVLPICVIPLMYGLWRGILVSAAISLVGTPLLHALLVAPPEVAFYVARGTLIGILANLVVAAMIGLLHDLLEQIAALNSLLNALSRTDTLTNLPNRPAVLEAMTEEFARTRRQASDLEYFVATEPAGASESHRPENAAFKKTRSLRDYAGVFSVAVLDIDHFKRVNDVHGHLSGDRVLRELALLMAPGKSLRATDLVGRFGGEEFVILLPLTSARNACIAVEKLRKVVADHAFESAQGQPMRVTISAGVSDFDSKDSGLDDVIARADQALYAAKGAGRNCVMCFEDIEV